MINILRNILVGALICGGMVVLLFLLNLLTQGHLLLYILVAAFVGSFIWLFYLIGEVIFGD